MTAKPELRNIARELNGPAPKRRHGKTIDPNPPREGQRGEFLKVTVTMPAAMWTELRTIGMQKRAGGEPNTGVSELTRQAIAEWLARQKGENP